MMCHNCSNRTAKPKTGNIDPQGANVEIKAIPVWYAGTLFRSTLEASWAATFDSLNWWWQYEPVALTIGAEHRYLPDFYLPTQRIWGEVKGPHNERIDKTKAFAEALHRQDWGDDEWELTRQRVVILRPAGRGETMVWENAHPDQDMAIAWCPECRECGFIDLKGVWVCPRGCRNGGENKFWKLPGGDLFHPGEMHFVRAPKNGQRVQPS